MAIEMHKLMTIVPMRPSIKYASSAIVSSKKMTSRVESTKVYPSRRSLHMIASESSHRNARLAVSSSSSPDEVDGSRVKKSTTSRVNVFQSNPLKSVMTSTIHSGLPNPTRVLFGVNKSKSDSFPPSCYFFAFEYFHPLRPVCSTLTCSLLLS